MREGLLGEAGARVVVEDYLQGEEVSFIAITDGKKIVPLASSQDHKRLGDGDQGPNTGGMGAYSPAPALDDAMHQKAMNEVMYPVIREMARRGEPYRGFLYAGLMIDKGVPQVLEFNARLGDPETQPLMFRIKSDIVPVLMEVADGKIVSDSFEWDARPAVCVVMVAGGYPGSYQKGFEITGLEAAAKIPDTYVFHAGTALKEGKVVSSGGRVLGVTSMGDGYTGAIKRAYDAVGLINFKDCRYRTDIGHRAFMRN
jgi:phosphoribosylamine--glycine ligase